VKDKQRRPWLSVITGGESLVSHAGGTPYPQAVVAFDLGESVGKDTPPCALC